MRRTGAQIIVKLLERQGVGTVAGIPGGSTLPLYDALRSRGDTERLIRWSRRPPGGESLRGLARRVLGYLTQLPNEPGLLVAHAGPIRVLWGLAHGLRREEIGVLRIPQEHALELDLPPGGWAALARRITPR